ncbi:MAG: cell envelope integrity protein CreD [Pseudomonadota bacterium]
MTQTTSQSRGDGPRALIPQRSAGLKLLLVCALALLMAIPALFVYGVIHERTKGENEAFNDVSARIGGEQSVLGPVLAVPYVRPLFTEEVTGAVTKANSYGVAIAYAQTGSAAVDVNVESRKRGIYPIPVFNATVDFTARFNPDDLRGAIPADAKAIWSDARLYVGLSDTRGVKETVVAVDGAPIAIEPATYDQRRDNGYAPTPAARVRLAGGEIPDLETRKGEMLVEASLSLTGAKRFALGPFARDTSVTMRSNWAHPSFTGGFLPSSHTAGDDGAGTSEADGFTAVWSVPYLARGISGAGANLNLSEVTARDSKDIAVRFLAGVSPYQSVERALKYAAMFIGFVFLAYFLFEITAEARAHPAQYVLVGLAQSIFYLLLLAFAERIGFDAAFALAAAMTVALTAGYAVAVFRSRKIGLRALGVLTGIYGLVYVLMRAQENALIAGALASFTAIALTMYMTRNIDWYGDKSPESAGA